MAKSCRQQIVEAVLAALQSLDTQPSAGGEVKGVIVELNRRTAIDVDDLPALLIYEGSEQPINDFSSEDAYDLPLLLQGIVAGAGADAVSFANNLRATAMKALMADLSLGGLARNLQFTGTGDLAGADIVAVEVESFELSFTVSYATKEGDPFTFENS
jgi:hypothetical protein